MREILIAILLVCSINSFGQTEYNISAGGSNIDCNFILTDGTGNYAPNMNESITICPNGTDGNTVTLTIDEVNLGLGNGDVINVYDGSTTTSPLLISVDNTFTGQSIPLSTVVNGGCMTVQFISDGSDEGTGFNLSGSCFVSCQPTNTTLSSVEPIGANGFIDVCKGDQITLTAASTFPYSGSSTVGSTGYEQTSATYTWDFGNNVPVVGNNVSYDVTQPNGFTIECVITDVNGCTEKVTQVVRVSSAPDFAGITFEDTTCYDQTVEVVVDDPNIAGGSLVSNGSNFVGGNAISTGTLQLPDGSGVSYDAVIPIDNFPTGMNITSGNDIMAICFNIEHSYFGDLSIEMLCPNGTIVDLASAFGNGGSNEFLGEPVDLNGATGPGVGYDYCIGPAFGATMIDAISQPYTITFVDNAGNTQTNQPNIPSGNYGPVGSFDAFIGCPVNGDWILRITDNIGSDDGYLFNAGITFDPSIDPTVILYDPVVVDLQWTPDPAIVSQTGHNASVNLSGIAPGSVPLTITAEDDFGCFTDTTITIYSLGETPVSGEILNESVCVGESLTPPTEPYTLNLYDSYGDGWSTNTVDVTINGVTTNYTMPDNMDFLSFELGDFAVGTEVTVDFNPGVSYAYECALTIASSSGGVVYQYGNPGVASFPTPPDDPVTFNVSSHPDYNFTWTPTTNIVSGANSEFPTFVVTQSESYVVDIYPNGFPQCATQATAEIVAEMPNNAGDDAVLNICTDGTPQDLFPLLGPNAQNTNEVWLGPNGGVVTMPYDPATFEPGIYRHIVGIGCKDTALVTVNEVEPSLSSTVVGSDCGTCNGQITITGVSNFAPIEYSNDNGVTFVPGNVFSGQCVGSFNIAIKDALGCVANGTVDVLEINAPTITSVTPVNIDCYEANDGTVTIVGENLQDYTINGPSGAVTNTTGMFSNLVPGMYDVTVDNGFGCTVMDNFEITQPDQLAITSLTNDAVICVGDTILLEVTGTGGNSQISYGWTANGSPIGTGASIKVSPTTSPTEYCVVMAEACGSQPATMCMTVSHPDEIIPIVTPDVTEGCYPVDVTFSSQTVSADIQTIAYTYGDGNTETLSPSVDAVHTYEDAGIYTLDVLITSVFGCEYTVQYADLITGFNYPEANITYGPTPVSMFDPTVNFSSNSSSDVVSQEWSFTGGSITFSTQEEVSLSYPELVIAEYPVSLEVINSNGCADTASVVVPVVSEVIFYAPNTFTPDGDEYNQTWGISLLGVDIYDYNMKIFNRWGEIVWESNDISIGWDGTYNGKIVKEGTYNWSMEVKDLTTDKRYSYHGYVTVLK